MARIRCYDRMLWLGSDAMARIICYGYDRMLWLGSDAMATIGCYG